MKKERGSRLTNHFKAFLQLAASKIKAFFMKMGDLTCDEDPRAGQGQPGQVSLRFSRSGVVMGHHVEVNPKRCGA